MQKSNIMMFVWNYNNRKQTEKFYKNNFKINQMLNNENERRMMEMGEWKKKLIKRIKGVVIVLCIYLLFKN